jgi:hypothetical protein
MRTVRQPATYPGACARCSSAAYPDIGRRANCPPPRPSRRSMPCAMAMGWEVVARARPRAARGGRHSDWFGFPTIIVIRIRAEDPGSRVDIRSKSRVGESDFGVNARAPRLHRTVRRRERALARSRGKGLVLRGRQGEAEGRALGAGLGHGDLAAVGAHRVAGDREAEARAAGAAAGGEGLEELRRPRPSARPARCRPRRPADRRRRSAPAPSPCWRRRRRRCGRD